MNEAELRKLLGDKRVDEILAEAKRLKESGMDPDRVAEELLKKFPDLTPPMIGVGVP